MMQLWAALLAALGDDGLIWVEGEAAKARQVQRHGWYHDAVKKASLSGGDWVSNFGGAEGTAEYEFEASSAGPRDFWVRANPVAGAALSYRLNGGAWTPVPVAEAKDQINIADNGAPDVRFIAWIRVGRATLLKGKNTLAFRMHSGNQNHGAVDCFLFTTTPFVPNGAMRPGQKLGLADPGRWAFEPDADLFAPTALLDLRSLNEKRAGESGWVKRTPEGDFALGSGRPLRFWAINAGLPGAAKLEDYRRQARFLAKRGVNLVRLAIGPYPKSPQSRVTDVDEADIARCQMIVAAMRDEGIYTLIVPYWGVAVQAQPGWGIPGKPSGALAGTLFWDETLQSGYKAWVRALFTRPSAYGPPLAKEPAVAIFQTQNEDSLLFWTIGHVKGEEARRFGEVFGRWLVRKYGSLEKAREAWPGAAAPGDDFPRGVAGFYHIWEMTQDRSGALKARLDDQLQFWTETMHAFNASIEDFFRKDLQCPVLINAGNWRTADQVRMLDAERWSYTANAVIGSNKYYGGVHVNPAEGHKVGYLVSQGDLFTDPSVLLSPREFALNHKQVAGYPLIISESTWVAPVGYQSEGPFLVAAYGALTGIDAYFWFAHGNEGYDPTINKWQVANPAMMGGFPAASLLFRKGYVKKGEPVVREVRPLADLWQRRTPRISEDSAFDPNRDAGSGGKASHIEGGITPLAFLAGPVEATYGGDAGQTKVADLGRLVDEKAKTVASITGELAWDYGKGVCRLVAPKAAGATGFLAKAGELRLGPVTLRSSTEYATVLAVSLDDRELGSSSRILVQTTTLCRPYGWKESPASFQDADKRTHQGKRIDDLGSAPWNVDRLKGELEIANPAIRTATVLDANGMPTGTVPGESRNGVFRLRLPEDALYVLLSSK
ncbi:MAG TPA: hypothetical protein VEJ18_15955 [Planctomycetota bacterium]|nr:hypothetical protein [Planctomycetota bacterium]